MNLEIYLLGDRRADHQAEQQDQHDGERGYPARHTRYDEIQRLWLLKFFPRLLFLGYR